MQICNEIVHDVYSKFIIKALPGVLQLEDNVPGSALKHFRLR